MVNDEITTGYNEHSGYKGMKRTTILFGKFLSDISSCSYNSRESIYPTEHTLSLPILYLTQQ